MPELPEVETIVRGIVNLQQQTIEQVTVRQPQLRYLINPKFASFITNKIVTTIKRRGKYIVLELANQGGFIIIHLGMSGRLSLYNSNNKDEISNTSKHDHVDIVFLNGSVLRYNDARRFGMIDYSDTQNINDYHLFRHLGLEPLSEAFDGEYLYQQTRKRQVPIKQLLMNNKIVVGIGNIYASEALFMARVHPLCLGKTLSKQYCWQITRAVKAILKQAIQAGGSSLRDYKQTNGELGYFQAQHLVYAKAGKTCKNCGNAILSIRLAGRNTFYCGTCQLL